MNTLFTGKLTRLIASDPDQVGELFAPATRDSEFLRLFDNDPAMPIATQRLQQIIRGHAEKERAGDFRFLIQHLQDDRLIGETGLRDASSQHHNAWVFIGIAERTLWGKGYGSDAMQILLRFAFMELNLHRVNLGTYEYNPRAIRAYEKIGFVQEGKTRQAVKRAGKRWDDVYMGILRAEWEAQQNG